MFEEEKYDYEQCDASELIKDFTDPVVTKSIKTEIVSLIQMSIIKISDRIINLKSNSNARNCLHVLFHAVMGISPEFFNENDLIRCQRIVSNIGRLSFLDETKILNDIEEFNQELLGRRSHKSK